MTLAVTIIERTDDGFQRVGLANASASRNKNILAGERHVESALLIRIERRRRWRRRRWRNWRERWRRWRERWRRWLRVLNLLSLDLDRRVWRGASGRHGGHGWRRINLIVAVIERMLRDYPRRARLMVMLAGLGCGLGGRRHTKVDCFLIYLLE